MPSESTQTVGALMDECGVAFGTSGARGLADAMTDRVCHGYTIGFLRHLASLGEFAPGDKVAIAGDLRPSTPRIMTACAQAVRDLGGDPVYCGFVPTPALALFAFQRSMPSLMVTGSHIPADRNGIKFYHPHGEVLKDDEAGMRAQDVTVAGRHFADDGSLIDAASLPPVTDAEAAYIARYVDAFGAQALAGRRIGFYQHSAVGRDVVPAILRALGAEILLLGRADSFVPVDTEAVRAEDIELAQGWAATHDLFGIMSTDGDSDRPLLADEHGEWLRGDVLGVLCARALGAQAVVTPVSSNSVLEKTGAFAATARTRIGSPYVIAQMNRMLADGGAAVCGYEANGGFLLASDFAVNGRPLAALPTRDAVLPVVATLVAAGDAGIAALVNGLPPRVTYSDRIADFPTAHSQKVLAWLKGDDADEQMARLSQAFAALAGDPVSVDETDGMRISFASGDIIHLRPSGNAPELRCYSEAETVERARTLNAGALAIVRDELAPQVAG